MKTPGEGIQLGVLGGGQLGQMLIRSAIDFGVKISTLDPDPECPACPYTSTAVQGSFRDYDDVIAFGKDKDILTIEIEDVNADALLHLSERGIRVSPSPHDIALIQDKGLQKDYYRKMNFPTAPHIHLEPGSIPDITGFLPGILKTRRAGYDGQGVMSVENFAELSEKLASPSILEHKIEIEKEISVVAARNVSGEIRFFPPVEMVFHGQKHILDMLVSPADISAETERQAQKILSAMLTDLDFVGLLAMEFFISRDGSLFVNEASPRPHNSGHQTMEGSTVSQYEQHLRAILGLPLGETSLLSATAMVNLLGAEGHMGTPVYSGLEKILAIPGASIHLYGKKETRPFRKMGHIVVRGATREIVKETAGRVTEMIRIVAKENV